MKSCAVFGCSNNDGKPSCRNLTFHRLPLCDKRLLKKWLAKCKTSSVRVNSNTRICSAHFQGGKRNGKGDVPTVFAFDPPGVAKRKPPAVRVPSSPAEPLDKSNDNADISYSSASSGSSGSETTPEPVEVLTPCPTEPEPVDEPVDDIMSTCSRCDECLGKDEEIMLMKLELVRLQEKLTEVEQEVATYKFRYENFEDKEDLVKFYTGLPGAPGFEALYSLVADSVEGMHLWTGSLATANVEGKPSKGGRARKLSPRDELFLTLYRLRHSCPVVDLAQRFGVCHGTVSKIFSTWVLLLYRTFKDLIIWPTRAEVNATMPECCFRFAYPTTRVVIDCTEVFTIKPKNPETQRGTFSSYKNHNTMKALVGITPSGGISFVSDLYGGSISDKEITDRSGLMKLLEPGDSIMADKGFLIADMCRKQGVRLNIPPFLEKKDQFTEEELLQTRRIASIRIHVERAMERNKNYRILTFLPHDLLDISTEIIYICAMLGNYHHPLVS